MAYNKKYAELGESVIDYVNDREDRIEEGFKNIAKPTLLWQGVQYEGELNIPNLNDYSIIQIVTGDANDTSVARASVLVGIGNFGAVHYATTAYGNNPIIIRFTVGSGKITFYEFGKTEMRVLKIYGII